MQNIDRVIPMMRQLGDLGVRLAIDDFGTGYSSLAYLAKLPAKALKIDRSFVEGLPASSEGETIVSSIITLAKSLALRVVAEGVETERQRELLCALGCDELQGFLFSRPVPAEQVVEMLRKAASS